MFTINARRMFSGMALAAVLGGASLPGHAQDLANGWSPDALEVTQVPPYCQAFFQKKQLPANCDGVHHLCAGKVLLLRVSKISIPRTERKRILARARQEVDYIFSRQNPSCAFMGEARAAQSEVRLHESILK